jgi:hypothetical protein
LARLAVAWEKAEDNSLVISLSALLVLFESAAREGTTTGATLTRFGCRRTWTIEAGGKRSMSRKSVLGPRG